MNTKPSKRGNVVMLAEERAKRARAALTVQALTSQSGLERLGALAAPLRAPPPPERQVKTASPRPGLVDGVQLPDLREQGPPGLGHLPL
jgi:hypothetical protein